MVCGFGELTLTRDDAFALFSALENNPNYRKTGHTFSKVQVGKVSAECSISVISGVVNYSLRLS